MWNFQDTFETRKRLIISAFSIYMTVPLKKSETRFCRRKTAKEDNVKINVSPSIPCTFLLFKASAFLQIMNFENVSLY